MFRSTVRLSDMAAAAWDSVSKSAHSFLLSFFLLVSTCLNPSRLVLIQQRFSSRPHPEVSASDWYDNYMKFAFKASSARKLSRQKGSLVF